MGIRVDAGALAEQLDLAKATDKLWFDYHKGVMSGALPLTIGGGIGQSRLCMLILGRAHIGQVQSSYWTQTIINDCKKLGIELL